LRRLMQISYPSLNEPFQKRMYKIGLGNETATKHYSPGSNSKKKFSQGCITVRDCIRLLFKGSVYGSQR
jgi:hypothetical protein